MKSQENTSTTIQLSSIMDESLKEAEINCIGGKRAVDYCTNENCAQGPFQCGQRKCKCHSSHKLCLKAHIDSTLQIIKSKITDTESIKTNISASFDKLIDFLSDARDRLISQIGQKYLYHKLHPIEKSFISLTDLQNISKFTSSHAAQLWSVIKADLIPKQDMLAQIETQICNFSEVMLETLQNFQTSAQQIFSKQEFIKEQVQEEFSSINDDEIFKGKSSVLTEDIHFERLKGMFERKISEAELIFKASEHDFNIQAYYKMCGEVTDTVIICKTNKDKIIGGYTPLKLNQQPTKNTYISDESSQSMIFSLTENDKFKLTDNTKAIYSSRTGISFGNAEFKISDKSSKSGSCCSYFRNAYYSNPNYSDDKESFLRLNGNQSVNFSTEDWEVWKIQFSLQEQ